MKVVDLHEDFGITSQRLNVISDSEQSNIELLKKFDDFLAFSVVFPHIGTLNERAAELSKEYGAPSRATTPIRDVLLEQVKFYKYVEREHGIKIVREVADIDLKETKFLISLEGTDTMIDPFDAYILYDLGIRCVGLTWNYDTKFAASCMSMKDYGLTGYGEELVKIANRKGLIVDLAHASKQTIIDAGNVSSKPIIVSHGNIKNIHGHPRNLDDESLEAIVRTGGIIGITGIPATLSSEPRIEDMIKHIDYVGNSYGWDHVALGTDFLGIGTVPKDFENITKVERLGELLGERSEQVLWDNPVRVIKKVLSNQS